MYQPRFHKTLSLARATWTSPAQTMHTALRDSFLAGPALPCSTHGQHVRNGVHLALRHMTGLQLDHVLGQKEGLMHT